MLRPSRIAIEPDDGGASEEGPEKTGPEPPPARAAASVFTTLTGLEDPAISQDELKAAEAQRREFDALARGATSSFVVQWGGSYALHEWYRAPRVKQELLKTERALSEVETGAGLIGDVNMFCAIASADVGLIDRFAKLGGDFRAVHPEPSGVYSTNAISQAARQPSPLALWKLVSAASGETVWDLDTVPRAARHGTSFAYLPRHERALTKLPGVWFAVFIRFVANYVLNVGMSMTPVRRATGARARALYLESRRHSHTH